MAHKPIHFLSLIFLISLLSLSDICDAKRPIPSGITSSPFDFIKGLRGCHKGNKSQEIHHLKIYLKEFGYLNQSQTDDDDFDDFLESAIKTYQQNFRIKPTGTLDSQTISTMVTPRCGVPDIINGTNYMQPHNGKGQSLTSFHIVSHFSFFSGKPKWSKRQLTYRFMSGFPTAAMAPVSNAFQKWATATQYFTFTQVPTNQISDLSVGFYLRSHNDGFPFDGPGGTLAHAFAPTNGMFHYDADEWWSVGPLPYYFDLETVAVHEIGHLLGLGHSQFQEAIMYPSISHGMTKDIQTDDIQGIRALYNY